MAPPIRIIRRSPSPDSEADFVAHQVFPMRVHEFLDEIGNNFPLPTETQNHGDIGDFSQRPPTPKFQNDNNPYTEPSGEGCSSGRRPLTSLDRNVPSHTQQAQGSEQRARGPVNIPHTDLNQHGPDRNNSYPGRDTEEENQRPSSRPKVRCNFGPIACRRRETSDAKQIDTP
jgi:hypothetical protein